MMASAAGFLDASGAWDPENLVIPREKHVKHMGGVCQCFGVGTPCSWWFLFRETESRNKITIYIYIYIFGGSPEEKKDTPTSTAQLLEQDSDINDTIAWNLD